MLWLKVLQNFHQNLILYLLKEYNSPLQIHILKNNNLLIYILILYDYLIMFSIFQLKILNLQFYLVNNIQLFLNKFLSKHRFLKVFKQNFQHVKRD